MNAIQIILVDTDHDLASAFSLRAEQLFRCHVTSCTDMNSCVALAKLLRPRIVFVDLALPDEAAFSTPKALREAVPHDLLVVAISWRTSKHVEQLARRAGFDECLARPIADSVLKELLAAVVPAAKTVPTRSISGL